MAKVSQNLKVHGECVVSKSPEFPRIEGISLKEAYRLVPRYQS